MHVVGFPGETERSYDLYKSTYDYIEEGDEELTDEILKLKMFGNQGVLTYVNQTSGGQSGGAVIQEIAENENEHYGDWETKHLIGIHVSGHLHQSKCTLLCKSNLDWMQSILSGDGEKNDNLFNNDSVEQRILKFMDDLEKTNEKTLKITDLEIFPVTSKIINMISNSTIEELKCQELCLDELLDDELKFDVRVNCFPNIFNEHGNITKLNLNWAKINDQSMKLFAPTLCIIVPHLIKLNLVGCGFTNIDLLCDILPNTKLEELILGLNRIGNDGFQNLLNVLPQTKLKTLNVIDCGISSLNNVDKLVNTLYCSSSKTKYCPLEELYLYWHVRSVYCIDVIFYIFVSALLHDDYIHYGMATKLVDYSSEAGCQFEYSIHFVLCVEVSLGETSF